MDNDRLAMRNDGADNGPFYALLVSQVAVMAIACLALWLMLGK